jgi:hypothetical protein
MCVTSPVHFIIDLVMTTNYTILYHAPTFICWQRLQVCIICSSQLLVIFNMCPSPWVRDHVQNPYKTTRKAVLQRPALIFTFSEDIRGSLCRPVSMLARKTVCAESEQNWLLNINLAAPFGGIWRASPCHHSLARPQAADRTDHLQIWRRSVSESRKGVVL